MGRFNPFFVFCEEYRDIVRINNPSLSNQAVTSKLGAMWRNTEQNEKQKYIDIAKERKRKFYEENPEYSAPIKAEKAFQMEFKLNKDMILIPQGIQSNKNKTYNPHKQQEINTLKIPNITLPISKSPIIETKNIYHIMNNQTVTSSICSSISSYNRYSPYIYNLSTQFAPIYDPQLGTKHFNN